MRHLGFSSSVALRSLAVAMAALAVSSSTASHRASSPTIRSVKIPRLQDASKAVPVDLSETYDFVQNTLPQGRRQDRKARRQRQHDRRGARLELVHASPRHRRSDVDRGHRPRALQGAAAAAGQVDGRRRQERRHLARPDDEGLDRDAVLRQVRPEVEPRDGERRRGHLDAVLLCARLQRAGELHRHRCAARTSSRRPTRRFATSTAAGGR